MHRKQWLQRSPLFRAVYLALILFVALLAGAVLPRPALAQSPTPTPEVCTQPHQAVAAPLVDLGNQVYVRMDGQNTGMRGGLYPGGSNLRPWEHETAGTGMARLVRPLDAQGGRDDANGKIVFISIGMSNTSMEFRQFEEDAGRDPALNPQLVIVNGAQSGRTLRAWTDPNADAWVQVDNRLASRHVTPLQVQVAWIKLTEPGVGDFPAWSQSLEAGLRTVVQNLKINYPQVKIAYLSSRTRSYQMWSGLSPEPAAYESAFAVKWLIEKQIDGDPGLNYDATRGPAPVPWLAWGPYLWIDGLNPRSDGLVWSAQDLQADCVHPSAAGQAKVAVMLMDFFKTDPTAAWFRNDAMVRDYFSFIPLVVR